MSLATGRLWLLQRKSQQFFAKWGRPQILLVSRSGCCFCLELEARQRLWICFLVFLVPTPSALTHRKSPFSVCQKHLAPLWGRQPKILRCRKDRADCPGKWSGHKMLAICLDCVQSQSWQCFGRVERQWVTLQPKKWISVPKCFSDISQLSSFCLPGTAHWYTGSFGKEPWWSKISGWEGKTSQKSLSCKSPQLSHVHSGEGVEAGKLCLWKCSPERFPQASVWSELKWRRWWQTRIRRPWVRNMLFDCDNLTMWIKSYNYQYSCLRSFISSWPPFTKSLAWTTRKNLREALQKPNGGIGLQTGVGHLLFGQIPPLWFCKGKYANKT